jgi:hypothetical protein
VSTPRRPRSTRRAKQAKAPPESIDPTAVGPFVGPLDGPPGTGPPGTPAPGTIPGKVIPGPSTVAGAWTTATALQKLDVDPQTKARIVKTLGELLPGLPLAPGAAGTDRNLPPQAISALIPSAAIIAAGLDPAAITPPIPNTLWQNGDQQLLVRVGDVHANLGNGLIEIVVPVTCDQTGDVDISVSFVTGTPDQPAGGIATTEDHPRGPAVVVENWAEPLIAYAWRTLVTATSAMSSAAGSDVTGRELVTAMLSVSPEGLSVTPMGRHTFLAGGAIQ